ncbi:hypothetical protein [Streptomyces mirabilis]
MESQIIRPGHLTAHLTAHQGARQAGSPSEGVRLLRPARRLSPPTLLKSWPSSKFGETSLGPIRGGHAEFVNAGAHKGWTATRLVAGAATLGTSAALTGRKNKGAAVINVTFGNGAAQTYNVTPENANLRAANQYVNAFNALAAQLEAEGAQQ